jgi:hypothetical protein
MELNGIYKEFKDIYNTHMQKENFKPTLKKEIKTVLQNGYNEDFEGYTFTTPSGLNVFAYRTVGTMGNHWYLYDLDNKRHLIIGRKTRKQIIKEAQQF